jgi:hypothetical protein
LEKHACLRRHADAGIAHYHLHDLRGRCISLLVMVGVPWPLTGQIVGDRRVSVTRDVYAHGLLKSSSKGAGSCEPVLPRMRRAGKHSEDSPTNESYRDDMEG